MRCVILGCGTSSGVPRIGNDWGACDPAEPRNRRLRASILIEDLGTRLLVDTSPDLRAQCLANDIDRIDAVLYSHDHADHSHGIDDLRLFAYRARRQVAVHADSNTLGALRARFAYAFGEDPASDYPPILAPNLIDGPFEVSGVAVEPFRQGHGPVDTVGFRFGPIAYSTDLVSLPEESFRVLEGVGVWIVDALRPQPHPTHAHLELTLSWIARVRPARAILTHMTTELDYRALCRQLPHGVEPAYDGLIIEA